MKKFWTNIAALNPEERLIFFGLVIASALSIVAVVVSAPPSPKAEHRPTEEPAVEQIVEEPQQFELYTFDKLVMAIAMTESSFNPDALGIAGDTGILQLREIYVREVNRLYGTDYKIEDAYDPAKSLELFFLMQQHYNPNSDIDTAIYYHNKSPQYIKRVKRNLEFIERYEEFRKVLSAYLTSFE